MSREGRVLLQRSMPLCGKEVKIDKGNKGELKGKRRGKVGRHRETQGGRQPGARPDGESRGQERKRHGGSSSSTLQLGPHRPPL